MLDDDNDYIDLEELKARLTDLSPQDIVKPAYEKWIPCQRTGYTIMDISTGEIKNLGLDINDLPLDRFTFIELYSIDSQEDPVNPKDLFSGKEYEEYLDFKSDDPSEYTPDIVSEFCKREDIDEDSRKISILADRFEEDEYFNYNKWESTIINQYYDAVQGEEGIFEE
ncbi:MAG: hypothetical protein KO202_08030 [Methanobacteriaceae archaeon]|jgi:hypothetical protein|nr:hypothetical protein [Methanobacteriaceae archaeon]